MYKLSIKKSALKELSKLARPYQEKIDSIIKSLAANPHPHKSKKLEGKRDEFRLKLPPYRILYSVNNKTKIITVYAIKHRKDVYRR